MENTGYPFDRGMRQGHLYFTLTLKVKTRKSKSQGEHRVSTARGWQQGALQSQLHSRSGSLVYNKGVHSHKRWNDCLTMQI